MSADYSSWRRAMVKFTEALRRQRSTAVPLTHEQREWRRAHQHVRAVGYAQRLEALRWLDRHMDAMYAELGLTRDRGEQSLAQSLQAVLPERSG